MNESETSGEEAFARVIRMLDIRIKIDEYEDAITEELTGIRELLIAGTPADINKALERLTILLDTMTEDVEEE